MKTIVVVDNNWGIGKRGNLLFRLKKDMAFFRATTLNKTVVMGANTYRSFPNGALPDRVNIVLDDSGKRYLDAESVTTLAELDNALADVDSNDVFVIGGASVYKLLLDRCGTVFSRFGRVTRLGAGLLQRAYRRQWLLRLFLPIRQPRFDAQGELA